MAKNILAVSPRPSNPVSQLAYLIHAALEARQHHSANFLTDYKQQLCTLVGLSFTAVLTEDSKIASFRPHIATFLRYCSLMHYPDKLQLLSVAIAEMICTAIGPFTILGFPRYYDDFLLALTQAVSSSDIVPLEIRNGIQEILLELLSNCE